MNTLEPATAVLLAVFILAVVAVLAQDLKARLPRRAALDRFGFDGASLAALQMLTATLALACLFGAVPLQLAVLAVALVWGVTICLGQLLALHRCLFSH